MLVTNKHKQSKKNETKKDAIRRIRHSPIEPIIRSNPKRHNQNVCPVCGKPLRKTASGGRRKHWCSDCGACLNRELKCASCGTSRVWQGERGAVCLGCGTAYESVSS